MIKVIFFDCFGVLMLTRQQTLEVRYPKYAERLTELSHQADAGFLGRSELVEQVAELLTITTEESDTLLTGGYVVNDDLVGLIVNLKQQGYKIGLISNLGRDWFDTYVPEATKTLFDDRVVSGEVGMVKPYPEIFELACSRLGVETQDALFIDDIASNCDGAQRAGMHALLYTSFASLEPSVKDLLLDER